MFTLRLLLMALLLGTTTVACFDDHEQRTELSEMLGRSVLRIAGHQENRLGPGEVLVVELEPIEDWDGTGGDCPVFEVEARVNDLVPAHVTGGNYSGGGLISTGDYGCVTGISFEVPWIEEFADFVDVRIWDESATLRAVYEEPSRPSITVSPSEADPGAAVRVDLVPAPVQGATAHVRIVGPSCTRLELGPHEVLDGRLQFEVPELDAGVATVEVYVSDWTTALVACEGPALCEPRSSFDEFAPLAETSFLVR